jgi:hypothetical protein
MKYNISIIINYVKMHEFTIIKHPRRILFTNIHTTFSSGAMFAANFLMP